MGSYHSLGSNNDEYLGCALISPSRIYSFCIDFVTKFEQSLNISTDRYSKVILNFDISRFKEQVSLWRYECKMKLNLKSRKPEIK